MNLLTGGPSLDETLAELVTTYDNVAFAVAWAGTGTQTYKALLKHRDKIHRAVIGTQGYLTGADVLDDFMGSNEVRFVLHPDGLFHPKAYLFWTDDSWELCVGSANLTEAAMKRNHELVLHVTSESGNTRVRRELERRIEGYWNAADTVSKQDASAYRKLWLVQQRRRPSAPTKPRQRSKPVPPVRIEIMYKPWEDFVREVIDEESGFFERRYTQIEDARQAFESQKHFAQMDDDTRKMIAGLPNQTYPHSGWFGSMKGNGRFGKAVRLNNKFLSQALDQIPLDGPVSRAEYDAFIEEFKQAFPTGGHGIATATRLLAMKRPDNFICFDSKNCARMCKEFGVSPSGMDYSRYWDEVILQIRDSVWWNASKPSNGPERTIWNSRAAMLDALLYDATHMNE